MSDRKEFDVLCVGSATEDVFVQVDETKIIRVEDEDECKAYLALEYGAKIRVSDVLLDTGGGATNTAVTFSRMGMRVGVVTKVGDDGPGERVIGAMEAQGIDVSHVARDPQRRTGYSVIITGFTGDRTILVYRGASGHMDEQAIDWEALGRTSWIYMGSLARESAPLFGRVAEFCGERGIKLAINPGSEQRKAGMAGLRKVFENTAALFVNRSEACGITGVEPDRGPDDEKQMLTMLCEAGCKCAVMTYGSDGSEGMDGSGHYKLPAMPAEVTSTVGAGDAYAAACVVALQRGKSLPEAMAIGSANAASVVEEIGAKNGILTWEQALESVESYHESTPG